MRSAWIRVAGGCLTLLGPILPTNATTGVVHLASPEPRTGAVGSASMDIWEEVLESMRLVCMMIGCTIERADQERASGAVEEQGWTVVLAYAAHGLRSDLSPAERTDGRTAVARLLGFIAVDPSLVSDDLRPLLVNTTESIGEELAQ